MSSSNPIKNVVVLMMENHSFDHMLGWIPGVGDLEKGKFFNLNSAGKPIYATPGAKEGNNQFDPLHDHPNVMDQLYNGSYVPPGGDPKGEGYVLSNFPNGGKPGEEEKYMRCYDGTNGFITNLANLSQKFITCNRWFSSVPGPTGPNRLFTHCATSGTYAGGYYSKQEFGVPIPLLTIFELIDRKIADNGWKIYSKDPPLDPSGLATANALEYVQNHQENLSGYDQFAQDINNGNQPRYSFIVPSLGGGTSQHPGYGDVIPGDKLIGEVYNTIRNNKAAWESTVLVITYDEHGGYYDSVNPVGNVPAPEPPKDKSWIPDNNVEFDFRILGTRVPTVLISPWFDASIDSRVYEHSSITSTIINLLGLSGPVGGYLSKRDKVAADFLKDQKYRNTPRTD